MDEGDSSSLFDDTDNDGNYMPSNQKSDGSGSSFARPLPNTDSASTHEKNVLDPETFTTHSRVRKRVQEVAKRKREVAKGLRNSGKSYIGNRGIVKPARQLRQFNHNCRYKCNETISEQERQTLFTEYWTLISWDLQTVFVDSCIKLKQPKRQKIVSKKSKKHSTVITIKGNRICKVFLLKTLDISNVRFSRVATKKSESGISPRDNCGRLIPKNKIPEHQIQFVKKHTESIPKYVSHYSRIHCPQKKFLPENLNISIIYNLYRTVCEEQNETPVNEWGYRHIFNTQLNLGFDRPSCGTCRKCDKLNNLLRSCDPEKRANQQKKADTERASTRTDSVVIVFDLQKTNGTNIETLHYKFLEPGHTFIECDQEFGLIENRKRNEMHVYVPDHWADVVRRASKTFQVTRMCRNDFVSVSNVGKCTKANVKTNTEGEKFEWRKIRRAHITLQRLYDEPIKNQASQVEKFARTENVYPTIIHHAFFDHLVYEPVPSEMRTLRGHGEKSGRRENETHVDDTLTREHIHEITAEEEADGNGGETESADEVVLSDEASDIMDSDNE
ncbi:hypothetical protein PR048_021046 [Dryococelus australis]|uniref:Uncharacterized protein n=1 Tax=Dryococelus australis TaxID=614101 RepID=A0ABQ9GX49_9NEOP|nr:hypothetical protein PR048_021046 [Dryococelus australis]